MYRSNILSKVCLFLYSRLLLKSLRRRLEYRATESSEALQDRLNKAAYEISFRHHFNNIIVNDNLQNACEEARHVISDFLTRQHAITVCRWPLAVGRQIKRTLIAPILLYFLCVIFVFA